MFVSCRSLSPSAVADPSSFVRSSSHTSFDTHSLPRRPQKGRVSALEDDPTKVQYCLKCAFIELTVTGIITSISNAGDRLCGLVVTVPGYRSGGLGSIPCATRFSEKWWIWNGICSASCVQLRSYLKEKVAAPVSKPRILDSR
jgi:hypothetical protein